MQKCPPPIFADLIAAGSCEARGGRQFNKAKTFFRIVPLDAGSGRWRLADGEPAEARADEAGAPELVSMETTAVT